METTNKEVVEKKTYVHDDRHDDYTERKARNGYGMGLAGVLTGGAALLSQWSNGRGIFGGLGGGNMPENVNINTTTGGAGGAGGAITVNIPHNIFFDMIFGDLGQVMITADDLLEMKKMLG